MLFAQHQPAVAGYGLPLMWLNDRVEPETEKHSWTNRCDAWDSMQLFAWPQNGFRMRRDFSQARPQNPVELAARLIKRAFRLTVEARAY
jgi:hypothetical protein